jgi:CSLREA domain-containing protein
MKRLMTLSVSAFALGVGLTLALLGVLGAGPPAARAATLTDIDTTGDDFTTNGNCTLREAIEAANTDTAVDLCAAGSGADTVLVPAGIYTLTIAPATPFTNSTGSLDVTEALTIEGAGAGQTTINGNGIDRALHVHSGAGTVVISGVTVYNGNSTAEGGGIRSEHADLILINTVVVSSASGNAGGGVCVVGGSLAMEGGRVVSNTAGNGGGGLYVYAADVLLAGVEVSANSATGASGRGGGLRVVGGTVGASVTLSGARVLTNTADVKGGGVYLDGANTAFTLTGGSAVANNRAYGTGSTDGGGGVYVAGASTLLEDGRVFSNTAHRGGGAFLQAGSVLLDGGVIAGNVAGSRGGGLYVNSGGATLAGGEVVSNTAINGGGGVFVNLSSAFLTQTGVCTIAHNSAGASGGGVYVNSGSAALAEGPLFDNFAEPNGGGLYVHAGGATLDGTRVVSNTAKNYGGGVYVYFGAVTLNDARLVSNAAKGFGGGVSVHAGDATLNGGEILSNVAQVSGGGVYVNQSTASLTQTGACTIAHNRAGASGGGVYVNAGSAALAEGPLFDNVAQDDGGGLCVSTGSATLAGTRVVSNTAKDDGGGLLVSIGAATLDGTRVVSNTAHDRGGGLYSVAGSATLDGAQIVGNTAHYAVGGAWLEGTATLVNTTISHNRALTSGPGGLHLGAGAAITITFTTVASNTGAGGVYGIEFTGPLAAGYIQNTLVAYNGTPLSNCLGILPPSGGYNLEDGDTCGFTATTDITGTDPLLGALTDDGGTLVHPLPEDSPAIEGGLCTGVAVDQRGVARPQGADCDIGAYEWEWDKVYLPLVLRSY